MTPLARSGSLAAAAPGLPAGPPGLDGLTVRLARPSDNITLAGSDQAWPSPDTSAQQAKTVARAAAIGCWQGCCGLMAAAII